ncbi:MAG: GTP-binding protein [archaeon]|nr:GTP-binding protein [archaeon]
MMSTAPEPGMIRNVAIIAHVDHGKTTLVDKMLRSQHEAGREVKERVMDCNALEQERGITILAKATSLQWAGHHLNVVDTPGHADFGGEVERIMTMVDGVVLVVDATEGPMTQTKYVLGKALKRGLKPIVVINKMDRDTVRTDDVELEIWDLFDSLGATPEQMEFPILYASGRSGWVSRTRQPPPEDGSSGASRMSALFETIISSIPAPDVRLDTPFSMLVSTLENDDHWGRIVLGRISSGRIGENAVVKSLNLHGEELEQNVKVMKIVARAGGLQRVFLPEAVAGDIVGLTGFVKTSVTDTVCDPSVSTAEPAAPIDPPTLSMMFAVNDSPLAGRDGKKMTARHLLNRLMKEIEGNVSIQVDTGAGSGSDGGSSFFVKGRGEMQLGVLIENMRREGYELSVAPPQVLMHRDPKTNEMMEPVEEVHIDVDDEYQNELVEKMPLRRAELQSMSTSHGKTRLIYRATSRGIVGLHAELNILTHGSAIMNHAFVGYEPYCGPIDLQRRGVIISMSDGISTGYALRDIEARGTLFIGPGAKVYSGMIIGISARPEDVEVNPAKEKHLSNVRQTQKDEFFRLKPVKQMNLEECLSFLREDQLLEITPSMLRLRMKVLDANERDRQRKIESKQKKAFLENSRN